MLCGRKLYILILLLYIASTSFGANIRLRLTRRRQFVVRCCSGRTSCFSNLGRISSTLTTIKATITTKATENASDSGITDASPQANADPSSAPVDDVKGKTVASNSVLVTSRIATGNAAATTVKAPTVFNSATNAQIINGGTTTTLTQGSANTVLTNNNLNSIAALETKNVLSTSSNEGTLTDSSNTATNSNKNDVSTSNPNSISNTNGPANSNSGSTSDSITTISNSLSNSNTNSLTTSNPNVPTSNTNNIQNSNVTTSVSNAMNNLSTSKTNGLSTTSSSSNANSNTRTTATINIVTTTVTTRCPSACTEESCLSANDTKLAALNQIPSTTAYPGNLKLIFINGSYYYFDNTTQLSWYDALAFCKTNGMKLVSIETQAEQDAINTYLQSRGLANKWIFISGNKIGSQCTYSWENGQAITYNNWNTGYPANEDTEECMVLIQGRWRDLTCTAVTYFMCQQIGGQTITTTTPCPYSTCVTADCNADVAAKAAAIKAVPATTMYPAQLVLSYLNDTYYYFEKANTLSWFDALTFCRKYGMDLLSIESQKEQVAINAELTKLGMTGQMVYTSGNKIGPICPYTWVDGSSLTYKNWPPGEPSSSSEENCLIMRNEQWLDLNCSAKVNFVCEQFPGKCAYLNCTTASCNNDVPALEAAIKAVPATTLSPTTLSLTYLNGGYYYFENITKKTWFDALTFCRKNGMDLVSIQSQAEQDAINSKLNQLGIIGNYVFTSGNKIGPKCPYTWVDGSPLTYTNWEPLQPTQSTTENCHITWKSTWWDLSCSSPTYFICEQLPGWGTTTTTPCPYVNCTSTICINDLAAKDAAIKAVPATTLYPATLPLTYLNGKYYYFGNYTKMTWFDALTFCRKHGMDLVSIQSQDEQDAVNGQLVQLGINGSYVFTSGNKIGPICPYTWVDGSPLSYEYWEIGQPSQASTENCLILLRNKWFDFGCSGSGYFVCEQLAGSTITITTTPCPYLNCTSADCNADVALKQDCLTTRVAASIATTLQVVTLNGRKYFTDPTKSSNYFDSIKFCRANGMDLATINSDAENTAIVDFLRSQGIEDKPVYLSGNKIGPICPFTWLDGSPMTYQNWNPGPPVEPAQSDTENCMCTWKRFWWDLPCKNPALFLCEEV